MLSGNRKPRQAPAALNATITATTAATPAAMYACFARSLPLLAIATPEGVDRGRGDDEQQLDRVGLESA